MESINSRSISFTAPVIVFAFTEIYQFSLSLSYETQLTYAVKEEGWTWVPFLHPTYKKPPNAVEWIIFIDFIGAFKYWVKAFKYWQQKQISIFTETSTKRFILNQHHFHYLYIRSKLKNKFLICDGVPNTILYRGTRV